VQLKLRRSFPPTTNAILGNLEVDGSFECYTLENRALCIPVGQYSLTVYSSPHAGHLVPLIEDVPGRDYIEIHCGNTFCDSKGCVLVGQVHTQDTIGNSQFAFNHLLPMILAAITRGEPVTIEVVDDIPSDKSPDTDHSQSGPALPQPVPPPPAPRLGILQSLVAFLVSFFPSIGQR